jgi:hypothetical protein
MVGKCLPKQEHLVLLRNRAPFSGIWVWCRNNRCMYVHTSKAFVSPSGICTTVLADQACGGHSVASCWSALLTITFPSIACTFSFSFSLFPKRQLAALLGKQDRSVSLNSKLGYSTAVLLELAFKSLRPRTLIILLPYDVKHFGML